MKWPQRKVADIADLCLGKMLDRQKNKGVLRAYLANINVRWGTFELNDLREMRFEERELDRYGVRNGDIVMCEGGEPGRCAVWHDQVPGMMIQKALHRIRCRASVDHRFLYYAFLDFGRAGKFEQFFTGSTIKHLPGEKLAIVKVPVPPLDEQRRIASTLSAYDDLIENNTRRIAILEEMARRIYQEWFVRFRFPGHEHVRTAHSELGPVPEGWRVQSLSDVADITMGLSPKGDTYNEVGEGTPLVNGPVEFGAKFTKAVKWTTAPTKTCKNGDLIVCVRGSTTGKYVKSNGRYCLGRGVCAIHGVQQSFVDHLFIGALPELLAQTGGSTFPSWTGPQLKSHPVLVPAEHLMAEFERNVHPMSDAIQVYSRQNANLRTTRDLLLPKLISGELDVSALPEPEAVAA